MALVIDSKKGRDGIEITTKSGEIIIIKLEKSVKSGNGYVKSVIVADKSTKVKRINFDQESKTCH